MSYRFADSLRAGSVVLILLASCQYTCMTYTIAVCTVKTPDDGLRNCPKHVEFYPKNKFEKLVHLVSFITRISPYYLQNAKNYRSSCLVGCEVFNDAVTKRVYIA